MAKSGRVAICRACKPRQRAARIDPSLQEGVSSSTYQADEVRDFQQVPKGEKVKVSKQLELGLIEKFNPENYKTSIASECVAYSMRRAR
jgi:hypothetical protein